MGLSAFAIKILVVFAISVLFSPGPGTGAKPMAPLGDDPTTVMPRKLDP